MRLRKTASRFGPLQVPRGGIQWSIPRRNRDTRRLLPGLANCLFDVRHAGAAKEEYLAAVRLTGDERDVLARQREQLGKECDKSFVGSAFDGRRVDRDLELRGVAFAVNAGQGGFLRAGLRANGERDAFRGFPQEFAAHSSESSGSSASKSSGYAA